MALNEFLLTFLLGFVCIFALAFKPIWGVDVRTIQTLRYTKQIYLIYENYQFKIEKIPIWYFKLYLKI